MVIGVPKEIKEDEFRAAISPAGVDQLVKAGHTVVVEAGACAESGISDATLRAAGAVLANRHEDVYARADLIVKVKEPLPAEYALFRPGQALFAYLHLAAAPDLAAALLRARVLGIAYETVELPGGIKPILTPMSEIAGRMSIQEGAKFLERPQGGKGILLGGLPGVAPAHVLILGGGVVGSYAARVAAALGARVTVMDINLARLQYLADILPENVTTILSNPYTTRELVADADLVIGGVLVTGARAPRIVTREMVRSMKPRSVIVDVAIDQGGCVETSRPTTHANPVYLEEGVVHYAVTNIPGAVPFTATYGLTNSTLPYILELAEKGFDRAIRENEALARGVNVRDGEIVHPAVKAALA
jgi:alanine dehydrogenase